MNVHISLNNQDIKRARANNPGLRERDLANKLDISEAEFVAAWCGDGSRRLALDMDGLFGKLSSVGEVMALTRNEGAVHEKIGVFENYYGGGHASMMLGEQIDTRMFPKHFVHAFEVRKEVEGEVKHSIQIFDAAGDAVQKIHARAGTDMDAWSALLKALVHEDQTPGVSIVPAPAPIRHHDPVGVTQELRSRWEKMTDTHQFVVIIRKLGLSRLQACQIIGKDFAWPVEPRSVETMLHESVQEALPIMCFVGSRGCIQIHSGPIENVKPMGPWLNVMDKTFHLHLRMDHIHEAWVVRKPTDKGHVTSVEAYDDKG
ncbi:MAG: hemin-degrading factor, partial [Rhizobiaceae bacterium]|nr:hemin-degrading factor [Rhizobiaceae bacterium]